MQPYHLFSSNIIKDYRYAQLPDDKLRSSRCLKDTIAREVPVWNEQMFFTDEGEKEDISCVSWQLPSRQVRPLEGLSVEAIVELNPTIGVPLVQELDKN